MERTVTLSHAMKIFHITEYNEININENEVKHISIILPLCKLYPQLSRSIKTLNQHSFETKIKVNPCVISYVISNTLSRQTAYHIRYMYEFYLQGVGLCDR